MERNSYSWKIIAVVLIVSILGTICKAEKTESVKEKKKQNVIGVVMKSSSSEYWMSVRSGMEAASRKYGMKVIIMSPNSELDNDVQTRQVEKLIDRSVDALAISPIDSYDLPDYMNTIEEQKIPTVTFDTGFEGDNLPYIGIDNKKTGYLLAQKMAEQMNHQGNVGIIAGDLKQSGHRNRVEGFKAYMMENEPDITISFVESGYSNLQMSEKKVTTLLQEYPEVTGIFATSAVTALGFADVESASGIKIATVDEQKDSLEALENGKISVLAAQSGYEIGYETIHHVYNMLYENEEAKDYFLEAEILTKDNLEEYLNASEKK